MNKLIYCELKKIFHKKSIYVIWLLLFIFCLINNILYKLDYDEEGYYIKDYDKDNSSEIEELEEKISNYNKDSNEDVLMYVSLKTDLDILKIKNNYDVKSWQYNKVDYLKDDIYNINYYTYVEKNTNKLEEYNKSYKEKINKFNDDNWQYFTKIEKYNLEENIRLEKEKLTTTKDKLELETINDNLTSYRNELDIINIRLNNNIDYGINYLNDALTNYIEDKSLIDNYDTHNLNFLEKVKYNDIVSRFNINKYIIDNKVNLNKENNLNYLLRTIIEDYELFIIIIILLVSASIVSEEFNKGTIKLLLIKPFSRSKILLSKYLTSVIILFITILFTIGIEVIIGGYLFGFGSLSMKVAVYNFNTNMVVSYNVFIYMFIRILYHLPLMIMVLTICFGISVISCNTVISVGLTMILYIFSQTINSLVYRGNMWLFRYFLTIHWDFTDYLFGGLGKIKNINFKFSLLVYIGYLVVFMVVIFRVFKRKNIKNI